MTNPPSPLAPAHERLSASVFTRAQSDGVALIPFITAGYPSMPGFQDLLLDLAPHAAAIEIGVPFSDPTADGMTIQRSSRAALQSGVSLPWILSALTQLRPRLDVPLVLMSYLNPILAGGPDIAKSCLAAGVTALIIPDLPFEERAILNPLGFDDAGIGLIQMVTPVTPASRLETLARNSQGFLYAVTMTGVTGAAHATASPRSPASPADSASPAAAPPSLNPYLAALRAASPVPVAAGFGIRTPADVQALRGQAHAAIIGSALIETLERHEPPAAFLASLRP